MIVRAFRRFLAQRAARLPPKTDLRVLTLLRYHFTDPAAPLGPNDEVITDTRMIEWFSRNFLDRLAAFKRWEEAGRPHPFYAAWWIVPDPTSEEAAKMIAALEDDTPTATRTRLVVTRVNRESVS